MIEFTKHVFLRFRKPTTAMLALPFWSAADPKLPAELSDLTLFPDELSCRPAVLNVLQYAESFGGPGKFAEPREISFNEVVFFCSPKVARCEAKINRKKAMVILDSGASIPAVNRVCVSGVTSPIFRRS